MKKFVGFAMVMVIMICAIAPSKAEAQPIVVSNRCCDNGGFIRCYMSQAAPLGNPCFCYGQGWGTTC